MRKASHKGGPAKALRCAIYTRKSTDHGLELEFNSLDAQREACEAYIKSQASEGWICLKQRYDDPAFSGGNMDRPALQRLLKDIESGLVDVIVVYKIDRLTRSLADFAKLVEVFDARSISFVAVTQQFNTTTSMGRLTLNILLSFAQFERELSSERVRDKVAASRRKGIWTGGSVPLGYDSKDKKLVVNEAEAKTVRMIFSRYLALKSFQRLVDELDQKKIVTKKRLVQGRVAGGIPFTYGPLAYLLKNRTYLGETGHKGSWFEGEHQPVIDQDTFDAVQQLLQSNSVQRSKSRQRTKALLTGLLYDDRGNRMSPSYSVKNGARYPFYVSSAVLKGRKSEAGSVARISGSEIETHVQRAIRSHLQDIEDDIDLTQNEIERLITRISISRTKITIVLTESGSSETTSGSPQTIEVPWTPPKKNGFTDINEPTDRTSHAPKSELVQAIVRAHTWLRQLQDGTYETIEELAQGVKVHPKNVRIGLGLAFLAPQVTRAILHGEQAASVTVGKLGDASALAWKSHCELLRIENYLARQEE